MDNYKTQMYEAINTAYEYNLKLIDGMYKAVELLRAGENIEAMEWLSYIIEGINWLIQVVSSTKEIQNDTINENEIKENLIEMKEALENTDYILLADLLEYEVMPIIQDWTEKISLIINE